MADERRVFTFEPGSGFTQVERAPEVKIERTPTEKVPVTPPQSEIEAPQPPTENAPPTDTPPVPRPEAQGEVQQPQETEGPESNEEGPDSTGENVPEQPLGVDQSQEEGDGTETPEETSEGGTQETTSEGEGETEPQEVPKTDDFFVVAATRLKATGALPDDFELPEDLTEDQADQAIYDAYVNKLKPEVNKELLGEFQTEMQKRGWTEDTLKYASLLQNGVRPEEIAKTQDYKTLSTVDASKMDDDAKETYVRQMYVDRGWNEKEIKRAIESADADGEIDTLVSESLGYFGNRYSEYEAQQIEIARANEQQKLQLAQYRQSVVSDIFTKKEIGGEKFTEQQLDTFEEALYTRSVPIQHEGQVYNLTPYEQFESALQQDFGLKLWAFKKWMFREQEAEAYKAQALKDAEDSRIVKWGKRTNKVKGAPDVPPTEQQGVITNNTFKNRGSETGGESFVFEGGEFKKIPTKK